MLAQLFLCYVIADLITGFFHWLEDAYATKDWPFGIGQHNIEHHKQPGLMGRMGTFFTRNLVPVIMALTISPILIFCGVDIYWVLWIALFTSMGNEVHAWNHRATNNILITYLQEAAIVQTKQQHARHHKPPYNKCYCVLSNLCNPILDYLEVWSKLEHIISLFGIKVKRMTPDRDGY
jgi:hypothetical protein